MLDWESGSDGEMVRERRERSPWACLCLLVARILDSGSRRGQAGLRHAPSLVGALQRTKARARLVQHSPKQPGVPKAGPHRRFTEHENFEPAGYSYEGGNKQTAATVPCASHPLGMNEGS